MMIKKIIGLSLILAPFVAVFALGFYLVGFEIFIHIFVAILIMACITVGVRMLDS